MSDMERDIGKIIILLIIFLVATVVYIYTSGYYVIVRFDELGPVSKNMAAYYNGFKVGKISSIEPDKDYEHTLVRVNLTSRGLKLPQNTTVQMKSFPSGELYLEFIYPQSPSLKMIKSGDLLEGISPYNLEQFMLGQNISGVTDIVSIHVIKALDAMQMSNWEMEVFFKTTSKFIQENEGSLDASVRNTEVMTKNLAEAAKNLNQASAKINRALDKGVLSDSTINVRDSTKNFKDSTKNLKETTENLNRATKDIDKTMQKVDNTVTQINSAAANINCITEGCRETLSKKFGGMRVIFGTPVKKKD